MLTLRLTRDILFYWLRNFWNLIGCDELYFSQYPTQPLFDSPSDPSQIPLETINYLYKFLKSSFNIDLKVNKSLHLIHP